MTHDLGVHTCKKSHPTADSLVSMSDEIGDIVPGIEHPDEDVIEMAVKSKRNLLAGVDEDMEMPGGGMLSPGMDSSKHPDVQPSVQVELSQMDQMEDDLDQVLSDLSTERQ